MRVYCNGVRVGSYFSPRNSRDTFDFSWDQTDFFGGTSYGKARCQIFAGTRYTEESNYVWSRKDVDVLARAPEGIFL